MDIHQARPSSAQNSLHYLESSTTSTLQSPSALSTQPQVHHNNRTTPSSTPIVAEPSLATIHEDGSPSTNNSLADDNDFLPPTDHATILDDKSHKMNDDDNDLLRSGWMNPSLMLSGPFDKRKSSPAILGLPFGITDDPQLDLHLSQHRNSIEAAVLLASFNRGTTVNKDSLSAKEDVIKAPTQQRQRQHWQDDLSIAAQTQDKTTDQDVVSLRRHSHDVSMNWDSMPQEFKERVDLFNNIGSAFKPVPKQQDDHSYYTNRNMEDGLKRSRMTWTQDGFCQATTSPRSLAPISPYPPRPLHPNSYPQDQRHDSPILHPLARQPSANEVKREFSSQEHGGYFQYGDQQRHTPSRPQFYLPPHHQHEQQHRSYYYPESHQHGQMLPPNSPYPSLGGKLPLPINGHMAQGGYPYGHSAYNQPHIQQQYHQPPLLPGTSNHPPPNNLSPQEYAAYQEKLAGQNLIIPATRQKRKRMPKECEEIVEAGDANFPDMCPRDVELAKTDPQARPRRQKLRFDGDLYTPKWVRFNGQAKEGLCDTCQPGRWLQLKNSAYWYHKQFYHGISSVSGSEFVPPAETRWVDQDLVEGLCHQCRQWVAVSNVKRKNSVLWFRHAHKCHLYNKPKNGTN